jgi:hypothetical protein
LVLALKYNNNPTPVSEYFACLNLSQIRILSDAISLEIYVTLTFILKPIHTIQDNINPFKGKNLKLMPDFADLTVYL